MGTRHSEIKIKNIDISNNFSKVIDHCETLLSYMNEKQIFDGINKRLGKIYFSNARANFNITKSVESLKKNQKTTRLNFLRGVK